MKKIGRDNEGEIGGIKMRKGGKEGEIGRGREREAESENMR